MRGPAIGESIDETNRPANTTNAAQSASTVAVPAPALNPLRKPPSIDRPTMSTDIAPNGMEMPWPATIPSIRALMILGEDEDEQNDLQDQYPHDQSLKAIDLSF